MLYYLVRGGVFMEPIALKGIKRLENNVILINNDTLKQLVNYISLQTNTINTLISELNSAKQELDTLKGVVNNNSTNIKTIARALEGAYKK
jgi:prefoldin subunit 5